MTRESVTRTQQQTPATHPLSSGILQRKCVSCGQHTIAGGECSQCKKRSRLQGRYPNQEEPSEVLRFPESPLLEREAKAFTESRVGYDDFSRLQLHTAGVQQFQTKLTVNVPGDKYEQEADRIAEQVMGMSYPPWEKGEEVTRQAQDSRIQRLCSECEKEVSHRPVEDEEEEKASIQTKAFPGSVPDVNSGIESRIQALSRGGEPLSESTRAFFEPRFGYDFSQVRIHTDAPAAETAQVLKARAFTSGRNVVFGAGQYSAETTAGKRLLAHELTHVVQQTSGLSSAGYRIQRLTANESPITAPTPAEPTAEPTSAETASPTLIAEDTAEQVGPGQMKKSEFLAELRASVCRTAETALAGTGQTTEGCPDLDYWFSYYRNKSSQHIERVVHRYAPETSRATTAREYIPIISERVRQAIAVWSRTGEVTGIPEEIPVESLNLPESGSTEGGAGAPATTGEILFKGRNGGVRNVGNNPQAIQAELGSGRPLDGGVKSRMESAFNTDFSPVQIHTDTKAASLSSRFNARAFTVGEHIAFGAGEYQPETLIGDALVAHELAHVVQQGGGKNSDLPMQKGNTGQNALEEDADRAAIGVIATLWGGAKGVLQAIAQEAMPRLKSGLRLQRCRTTGTPTATTTPTPTPTAGTPCPTSVRLGTVSQRNHSNLSPTLKERYRTFLGAMSRMDVGPGPDHSGHCMKERMTLVSNNCPAAVYQRGGRTTQPCTGNKCLDINRYGSLWGVSDGPTAFLDMHRTRTPQSLLEGTGVRSCTVVCEQTYSCDRRHPTTGRFRITRNYQAGSHTRSDGTNIHITTGTVTKRQLP